MGNTRSVPISRIKRICIAGKLNGTGNKELISAEVARSIGHGIAEKLVEFNKVAFTEVDGGLDYSASIEIIVPESPMAGHHGS